MSTLDKAIEDLRAVVEAYALGKVDESVFVLPANAVLAAYAAVFGPAVPRGRGDTSLSIVPLSKRIRDGAAEIAKLEAMLAAARVVGR